ncbi:TM2 domain-containing protein CG10795-like [Mya arenaria]|uniref:TM2 domain-containing protein CG10795-like n=1 Tax=Mya arenaria TaxID=6604 RepID=UPI0022DEB98E|nr:TM2 domain-containing protein CG10795-like [Mya arenaria]XP_052790515.1 TM2 domain-containing protein CG10795-like [Mya arenaria]
MDISKGLVLFISQIVTLFLQEVWGQVCFADETGTPVPFSLGQCSDLLMGQYMCDDPEIDIDTQAENGCDSSRKLQVGCRPAPSIVCVPDKSINSYGEPCNFTGLEIGFYTDVPCKWTNGYSFETALLLSVFLGMFGIDRFYLGYPAIGLLKFSTLGFFFLGQLVDVLLIATQTVKPSDGSDYVIDYYGAGLVKRVMNNETIINTED